MIRHLLAVYELNVMDLIITTKILKEQRNNLIYKN
jgi:hypothetical protein